MIKVFACTLVLGFGVTLYVLADQYTCQGTAVCDSGCNAETVSCYLSGSTNAETTKCKTLADGKKIICIVEDGSGNELARTSDSCGCGSGGGGSDPGDGDGGGFCDPTDPLWWLNCDPFPSV